MAVTLEHFLSHPCVANAAPRFLGPRSALARTVSWVHSSEIYEIAPLLAGGEVLLTTGLGLAGADAGSRRHWVREVAAREVAAVAIEPGRSLVELPPEIEDESRRRGLPLVVLERVVPFAQICRELNSDILSAELSQLRRADDLLRQLHQDASDGAGLAELTARVSRSTGEPVSIRTLSGQVVASTAASGTSGVTATDDGGARSVVRAAGAPWGHVLLGARDEPELQLLADRLAALVGLVVERTAGPGSAASAVSVALLTDLLDRPTSTSTLRRDVVTRAGLAGFHPGPHHRVVGVAGTCADPERCAVLLARTSGLGPHLLAPVRGQVLGLVAVTRRGDPAGEVADRLDASARLMGASLVVGPPVELEDASETVTRARDGMTAGPLNVGATTWRTSSVDQLLARRPKGEIETIVKTSLGPLIEWDRTHGTHLVTTLASWLSHGLSVTATARAMRVRRQTAHERLARIERLLGYDPAVGSEPAHLALAVAGVRITHPDLLAE
ncbi:helix-turn-helix domain-containing protein [Ornithinimicrobium kibberense]|uniref:PucR family transcriptional regulator ligand-binding domain-containing protein n=3 Tax=Ornithinimicrobium kibberense TaxID=282060 RepID=A0ABV5V379_9MICO|nr:PucR family transcriptional regulator [Ornithinimicrobium kibberense]